MSFPIIPNITPTISITTPQTIPLLFASIALEELALAHIINAEAEKLQFVLGTLPPGRTTLSPPVVTISNLLAVDSSVQRTLRDVIKKEMLLEFKFENILDLLASSASSTPGSISIAPVTGATCGAVLPISGTLLTALGLPLVGAQVTLAVTGATAGANVTFSTTTPITDLAGNFSVLGTFTGVSGPNSVTITATATSLGVTVTTSQTITFVCP
ncbi:carboxypeptidase-like regulatory domain-containing protein [Bacillus sp. FJAT-51639]|uniref:Carboxypeptidase-like regulatory domain-containing protein n=1 Tax=Bacillus bruguierae TaxID=3127667 RepID=A0ABU8FFJ3_9BACI